MENASKALIIAGSIIISLVIVSLGILVYRRVSGTVTNADVSQQQIEAHNSEYEAYFGDYVSAANTKSLLSKIKTNNTLYEANKASTDELVPVWVSSNQDSSRGDKAIVLDSPAAFPTNKMTDVIKKIKSSKHYRIQVDDEKISAEADVNDNTTNKGGYYQNGYIRTINITEAK